MVVFGMVKYAPTDDLQEMGPEGPDDQASYFQQIKKARAKAATAQVDRPVFYFSLTTADQPDTLDRIFPFTRRERLLQLLDQSGNWPALQRFENALVAADQAARQDTAKNVRPLRIALMDVHDARHLAAIADLAKKARQLGEAGPHQARLDALAQAAILLKNDLQPVRQWQPAFHWYGTQNQYHRWLGGFLSGNLGQSVSGRPVWATMRFSLLTTLVINGLAFFLAFRISIPLGILLARRRGRVDRIGRWVLLLLHSMPGFWLGGLLLLLFATPHTGLFLINGINLQAYDQTDGPFLLWVGQNVDKFILPVLTLSLHALALIALQLRGSIREVLNQDFIRTARAKGVAETAVYQQHAFRNSLIPLITIFSGVFPALFAGSIVVEYLFNFPGLGMKTLESYQFKDYPLLFAILMLGSVMTVLGNFLGDVLYAWADPRIRFDKQ